MMEHNTVAERLKSAEEDCDRLRAENVRLRAMLGIQDSVSKEPRSATIPVASVSDGTVVKSSTAETKIALFGACFAVAKTFMQYVGKERMESLAILLPVLWIGTRLMPRDQRIEKRSQKRRGCSNRSLTTRFAITSQES
jgi:hypothetical protein